MRRLVSPSTFRALSLLLVGSALTACGAAPKSEAATPAAPTAPAAPGSFEEQAQNGAKFYETVCADCHGKALKGGNRAPSLLGKKALAKNAQDTFDYLKGNMPPEGAGKHSDQDYWNVTAFLIAKHHWPVSGRLTPENAASVKPAP